MTAAAIRKRLNDFIRVADDKKVKAIYTILEDEIVETTGWWKNEAFVKEMDEAHHAWESGKEKAFTLEEVDAEIELLKKERQMKA